MQSDFIVIVKSFTEIYKIAQQIKDQSIPPDFVAFALVEKEMDLKTLAEITEVLKRIKQKFDGEIVFSLTRILETKCIFECIDICVRLCKGDYYSVILADHELPDYFNFQLDTIVDNHKTYMITPKEGVHGLVVHRKLHKHLGGNMSFDDDANPYLEKITDKIQNYAKKEAIYAWE